MIARDYSAYHQTLWSTWHVTLILWPTLSLNHITSRIRSPIPLSTAHRLSHWPHQSISTPSTSRLSDYRIISARMITTVQTIRVVPLPVMKIKSGNHKLSANFHAKIKRGGFMSLTHILISVCIFNHFPFRISLHSWLALRHVLKPKKERERHWEKHDKN